MQELVALCTRAGIDETGIRVFVNLLHADQAAAAQLARSSWVTWSHRAAFALAISSAAQRHRHILLIGAPALPAQHGWVCAFAQCQRLDDAGGAGRLRWLLNSLRRVLLQRCFSIALQCHAIDEDHFLALAARCALPWCFTMHFRAGRFNMHVANRHT